MKPQVIVFMLASSQLTGCSSIMSHLDNSQQRYYPGSASVISRFHEPQTSWAMWPLMIVDLPTSALLDTLLLPYDYYRLHQDKVTAMPSNSSIVPQRLATERTTPTH